MPSWYRTGTVAVTNGSATVTGTGTAWTANINVGDAMHLSDGKVYEVTAIASNTSMSIAPNYLGSTGSGQNYAVQPTRGLTVEYNANAVSLLGAVQGFVDGPLAGRFPDGTVGLPGVSFAADTNNGLRRIAADRWAGVAAGADQFEVNATDGLLVKGSRAFRRNNILGIVSQAAGVPTGAIIERGSNANGDYTKFADGTMIATKSTLGLAFSNVSTCQADWTFPVAFVAGPAVTASINFGATLGSTACALDQLMSIGWANSGSNSTIARLSVRRVAGAPDFVSGNQVTVQSPIAIGRWF